MVKRFGYSDLLQGKHISKNSKQKVREKKKMKKLFLGILVAVVLLGVSSPAYATRNPCGPTTTTTTTAPTTTTTTLPPVTTTVPPTTVAPVPEVQVEAAVVEQPKAVELPHTGSGNTYLAVVATFMLLFGFVLVRFSRA